ncbi:lamin tail domain-containing protein [Candidatus Woesearchaeota archaeon]|nr:lamin tail domain-containing protein [Candidatus Woesearchaeota archaeon]
MEKYLRVFLTNLVLFFGLGSGVLANSVVISEVYYDPVATESGGEAVVLYNPTPEDIILSGYVLKTESAAQDVILPTGTIINYLSFSLF